MVSSVSTWRSLVSETKIQFGTLCLEHKGSFTRTAHLNIQTTSCRLQGSIVDDCSRLVAGCRRRQLTAAVACSRRQITGHVLETCSSSKRALRLGTYISSSRILIYLNPGISHHPVYHIGLCYNL